MELRDGTFAAGANFPSAGQQRSKEKQPVRTPRRRCNKLLSRETLISVSRERSPESGSVSVPRASFHERAKSCTSCVREKLAEKKKRLEVSLVFSPLVGGSLRSTGGKTTRSTPLGFRFERENREDETRFVWSDEFFCSLETLHLLFLLLELSSRRNATGCLEFGRSMFCRNLDGVGFILIF